MSRRGKMIARKSATRSASLKGRTSHRKQTRQRPRQELTVGLVARPKPDPNRKPWPKDCVQIAAATQATVNVRGIRGHIVDQCCADCSARLAVDSETIRQAWELPQRQGRPVRFICVNCCRDHYDRSSIQLLIDHRNTTGSNEGNELDLV